MSPFTITPFNYSASKILAALICGLVSLLALGIETGQSGELPLPSGATSNRAETDDLTGTWVIALNVGSDQEVIELPIMVRIAATSDEGEGNDSPLSTTIINGVEEIRVGPTTATEDQLTIEIPHYASKIVLQRNDAGVPGPGVWHKVRGAGKIFQVPCQTSRWQPSEWDDPAAFTGRWSVKFADSEDLAVGEFHQAEDCNQVYGTFLTTTGDYRFLAGGVKNGRLSLSCFDGAHAFHFEIDASDDDSKSLSGTFHSGNWYQTTWTATRDDKAALPDAFTQTQWTGKVAFSELKFPNLQGELVSLDDEQFAGKCRIIEVFGSWCPNCHDAGLYLSELHETYAEQGLSIVGLAFELSGDFQQDAAQVKTFIERNQTKYPILIAGTSDKTEATDQLKILDKVRSYPTMIFLDRNNQVKAIYTGFSGPATGEAHDKLREQFRTIIENMLQE